MKDTLFCYYVVLKSDCGIVKAADKRNDSSTNMTTQLWLLFKEGWTIKAFFSLAVTSQ